MWKTFLFLKTLSVNRVLNYEQLTIFDIFNVSFNKKLFLVKFQELFQIKALKHARNVNKHFKILKQIV